MNLFLIYCLVVEGLLRKYNGSVSSLALQTVINQFSFCTWDCSRSCCIDLENKDLYPRGRVSRPLLVSKCNLLLISCISLGWKDLFLSCRKLFMCSQRAHAICQMRLCAFDKRSCDDCECLLMFIRCCC